MLPAKTRAVSTNLETGLLLTARVGVVLKTDLKHGLFCPKVLLKKLGVLVL